MKPKICKVCLKRRDGINWRTFPNILPHIAWSDEKGVIHFRQEHAGVTYCKKLVTIGGSRAYTHRSLHAHPGN